MKRLFVAIAVSAFASSVFAGLTYKTQSTTTGMQNITINGTVSVEGSHVRFDVANGDQMLFKDNDVVLSSDGGRTMSIFDPATKNYFDIQLDQLLGTGMSMFERLGSTIKVTFNNPHVNVRDAGDGGTIEGYPTHKYVLDATYDIDLDVMGQKNSMHVAMNTESWTTDRLSSEFTSFLQMRGIRTGIETIDKLIEAGSDMHGFPLKQHSTVTINQGGNNNINMTTTSSVTNIEKRAIDAAQFATPTGYTKVDDPVTRMMKQLKQ